MNIIERAEPDAVYNLLLYLLDAETAKEGTPLSKTLQTLTNKDLSLLDDKTRSQFTKRLNIVQQAFLNRSCLADATITAFVTDYNNKKGGMKSLALTEPTGAVHIIFAGTGAGEWIDNGEGLSGVPEYNLYEKYDKMGKLLYTVPAPRDYATGQQAEALNWFNKLCAQNDRNAPITVSGHSKGGNKAQFVAVNSQLVTECYSFDGQGFSPEAIGMFKAHFSDYETRRGKIYSLSADNDYVNVLGERLAPEQNVLFLRSSDIGGDPFAYHYMETLLNGDGKLNPEAPQGEISEYIQNLSRTIMSMPPHERQPITLSIMSVFQHLLGGGAVPVNNDHVSDWETVKGVISALAPTVTSLLMTKDGREAAAEIAEIYRDKLGAAVHDKAAAILSSLFTRLKAL